MVRLRFDIDGIPAPQGSKIRTRFGMREASKRVGPWRDAVVRDVRATMAAVGATGPLAPPYRVGLWFFIPRPKRTAAEHPVAPSVGDLDKLIRSTLDGLVQAGLIVDDRYVVEIVNASKAWSSPGQGPGAVITVLEV